jgi:[citrate (pro-3S)-lyase] ligase
MPALNVSTRVAGEEPYCRVTREYNRQIKDTFEKRGKRFIQIERKKMYDYYISASRVRRALMDGDFDLIKTMVPITTYNYLFENRKLLVTRIREMEVTK